jgi:phage terminase Nu1 subunit (DNA packaging protein)
MGRLIPFPRRNDWEPWVPKLQTASHYGVSTKTVERWVKRGCPSRMIGNRRHFRLSAVDEFLAMDIDDAV